MTRSTQLAERLVHRVGSAISGARMGRRSFFTRTAVVGSALVLDPVGFSTRPVSAYDAVCGDAASCADGFSVFCCTINNGANFCPEGTFLGGWWKADNSGFCCGGPRYYMDCNVLCGSTWVCSCDSDPSTCDHRLVACNQFRYGQCHLEIDCYGPVACRLVTCTPPWSFDPSCTASSASDQSTVSHSAPCLPGDCPTPLILHYYDLGGPGGPLGVQIGQESPSPAGGGSWAAFANGALFDLGAAFFTVEAPIYAEYLLLGGPAGLGNPTMSDQTTLDGLGRWNQFATGSGPSAQLSAIYSNPVTGTHSVSGRFRGLWGSLNWENGPLGYPATQRSPAGDKLGAWQNFAKLSGAVVSSWGSITHDPDGTMGAVWGPIFQHWRRLGREAGPLGYPVAVQSPTADGVGSYVTLAPFTGTSQGPAGSIYYHPLTGAFAITGPIRTTWQSLNWENGPLGYPSSDIRTTQDGIGSYATFAKISGNSIVGRAAIYHHPSLGTWAVSGAFYARWVSLGAAHGTLGYPIAAAVPASSAGISFHSQLFEHGEIYSSRLGRGCAIWGGVLSAYLAAGGPTGSYGLPLSTQQVVAGVGSVDFQNGTITTSV